MTLQSKLDVIKQVLSFFLISKKQTQKAANLFSVLGALFFPWEMYRYMFFPLQLEDHLRGNSFNSPFFQMRRECKYALASPYQIFFGSNLHPSHICFPFLKESIRRLLTNCLMLLNNTQNIKHAAFKERLAMCLETDTIKNRMLLSVLTNSCK